MSRSVRALGLIALALTSSLTAGRAAAATQERVRTCMEDLPADVRAVAEHVLAAKRSGAPHANVVALAEQLEQLAAAHGIAPARVYDAFAPASARTQVRAISSHAPAALLAPGCAEVQPLTQTFTDSNVLPIPDATGAQQTAWGTTKSHLPVAMPGVVWDVNLRMNLDHTRCNDLRVFLIAPSGRQITITTDNNVFSFAGIFNGTLWDDSELVPVTDYPYVNDVAATAVCPEGAFGAFIGEDPNGVWTLVLRDDLPSNTGVLNGWSLEITTIPSLPPAADHVYFVGTPQVISDGNPVGITQTVAVSGIESYVVDVNLQTAILHTFPADLSVYLIAPSGKRVAITTRNGGPRDHVFNGTVWDDQVVPTCTDFPYVANQAVPFLVPDGCLSAFIGEDPNGTWTLQLIDDLVGDQGTIQGWALDIVTCAAPAPGFAICSGDAGDGSHVPCPCGNFGALGNGCANSANANGANLAATGTSSPDTVTLQGSGMPATALGLYIQHDNAGNAVFHDGVLCASGTLVRLRSRASVSGSSAFPNSSDTITLSQRGGVVVGSGVRRYYGIWYRNPASTFCPPALANVTNGWVIDW